MIRIALYSYIPRRALRRASFEEQDICRKVLGFKDGRNIYSRWAAREFAGCIAANDLRDVVIICVPASSSCSNVRRWKRFCQELCSLTGAANGFDYVSVSGSRKKVHTTGERELCTNIKRFVAIDSTYFQGKKVLVIDDICTTGQSANAFIGALQAAGATVIGAMFLAKTRSMHRK